MIDEWDWVSYGLVCWRVNSGRTGGSTSHDQHPETMRAMNTFTGLRPGPRFITGKVARALTMVCAASAALFLLAGCQSPPPTPLTAKELTPYVSLKLREGDVLSLTFPGSTNLNTVQQIQRDGSIDLPLMGKLNAVGKTPAELEKELLNQFKDQLAVKEVSVALRSSSYPVFVTGAVVRPGKITAERPLSALEAIMEAGGFAVTNANMKAVVVVRNEEGQIKHFVLNLKRVLEGKSKEIFYLQQSDIIYFPEKAF